ncbi:3086_t:CDS:1, partial [Racocetra fulgida]
DLILVYISEKEKNQQTNMQSEYRILRENVNLKCEIKLSDSQVLDANNVKDLIEHKGKGRPANKQLKAYNERNEVSNQKENIHEVDNSNSNHTVSSHKCRLCHKTSYYAPKCFTKNSNC